MNIFNEDGTFSRHFFTKKTRRVMRITLLLLTLALFKVSAVEVHAQNPKITLNTSDSSIKEILKEIENQSDFTFFYNDLAFDMNKKVQVNVTNKDIREILRTILPECTFEVDGKRIILIPSAPETPQQTKAITGVVKDAHGELMIGVNVVEKGTSNGVVTDINGHFKMNVQPGAILVISYIGYLSQEIPVRNQTNLSIELEEDTKVLDDVVVIGYGTTSVRKMTAAVTSIKGEVLEGSSFNTVGAAMQGRLAGVIVQQEGGEPGSTTKMSIRGGSTPLYVIDGIISSAMEFNSLNPTDIETMSILKDAAALAVYGSRAADGIILVKTRQGGKGKTTVTYNFNAQFSQPTKLLDTVDSYTYATEQNRTAVNDGFPTFYMYDEETINAIRNQSDPYRYANTDWMALGLKDFAPEYRHSLSLNGSGKLANYFLSLGALNQGSLYSSDALHYDRYTLRSNVNTTFEQIGLTIGFNVNGAVDKREYPSYSAGEIWGHLLQKGALLPAYNSDGTYAAAPDHPLVEMDKRSGYNKQNNNFVNFQFVADWNMPFAKEITLGTMIHYRLSNYHEKVFKTKAPQYYPDGSLYPIAAPTLKEEAKFGNSYDFELNAAYLKTFNNAHTVDAKVIFTVTEGNDNNFWASRKDYISSAVDQLFAGSPQGMQNSGNAAEEGRMGFVGRFKYDYKNRYIIEGNFRYDGSDNFAPGHRWGFFPSGAVAWTLSDEPFFKSWELGFVDMIKLRASYGQTGTDRMMKNGEVDPDTRFAYLSTYGMDENAVVIGGKLQSGFSEGTLVSPTLLSWYTRNSLNYGLDFILMEYKLKGDINYFYYVTKGGLMNPGDRYSTPLGKKLPMIKSDSEQRREGIDFSLQWEDRIGNDFTYTVGVNGTYYNNLWVKKADEPLNELMNPWKRETHQTDYFGRGYKDNGFYQTPEQVVNAPRRPQSSETKLGDISYQDINGDGKIDEEDQVRMGMPKDPHFTYGINFGIGYKGFGLSGVFYGTGTRYLELGETFKKGEASWLKNTIQLDYWREDNRNAIFPRMSTTARANGDNNLVKSSFWMKNAAFFRLKNLQVDYDFKYKLLKNADWLNICRISLSGTNLFTISKINKFFDPETGSTDGYAYPVQRVFSVGLTVGF